MITIKKQAFFKEKLSETIGKSKELWESLKSRGVPNKTVISNFNAIKQDNTLTRDTRSIWKIFENFISNLVESLLIKLPKPPVKYNLKPAIQYYSSLAITTHFCLVETTEKQVLKIKQDIKSFKAAGEDKLLVGRLLNDGADILAKLVPVLCNLSISRRVFPSASKVGN